MKDILLSTLTGALCGAAFALARLPVPAPPMLSGLMGIFGLWLGYKLVMTWM